MSEKDLKINFRYLMGNIACMSVDSASGKSVHNDINNEEAIIIFNSLVGEKENCQSVKTLLNENQQLKEKINTYEDPEDLTLMFMYCDEKAKDKIKELRQRIDKAIEYIEKESAFLNDNEYEVFNKKDLLEILKGKE